jgi:CheY-like chemotaxis protein
MLKNLSGFELPKILLVYSKMDRELIMHKNNLITVLVVDDDPSILSLVKEQLYDYGYQPIMASSGEEALEIALQQTHIDLLLTDIKMPGINGIDLVKQLSTVYPDIRVLFMSVFTLPSTLYRISGKEMIFLQKPFLADTLIKKMEFALS